MKPTGSKSRLHNVRQSVIAASILVIPVTMLSGCMVTRTVTVTPECTVPIKPVLPVIDSSKMQSLDDQTYWDLMDRERRLTDWAYEQRSMLNALCGGDHADE